LLGRAANRGAPTIISRLVEWRRTIRRIARPTASRGWTVGLTAYSRGSAPLYAPSQRSERMAERAPRCGDATVFDSNHELGRPCRSGPSQRLPARPIHGLAALHLSPSFSAWCLRLAAWAGRRDYHYCASRAANGERRWPPARPCPIPHSISAASPFALPPSRRARHDSTQLSSVGRSPPASRHRPYQSHRPSTPHSGLLLPAQRAPVRSTNSPLALSCRSGFRARRRRQAWDRSSSCHRQT
jgi:hypothetical protein